MVLPALNGIGIRVKNVLAYTNMNEVLYFIFAPEPLKKMEIIYKFAVLRSVFPPIIKRTIFPFSFPFIIEAASTPFFKTQASPSH